MFIQALIIIAIISVVWAFWSLKKISAEKEIGETKKDLKKGRVLFRRN